EDNPGSFRAEAAANLVRQLGIESEVVQLGAVPYGQLHHLHAACDLYVTPAYAETFAHHVVEAMASGLPIIAADTPLHREICGESAVYFSRFSPEDLAVRVAEVAGDSSRMQSMSGRGKLESERFNWGRHVDEILALATSLDRSKTTAP